MKEIMDNLTIPKHEDYKDSLVAFVDLLGFESKINDVNSEDKFLEVAALLAALKETAGSFRGTDPLFGDLLMTSISDSIVITIPYSNKYSAFRIIALIQKLQYDLIASPVRTLSRGYLSRGYVYHKDQILFGKGYSDAYRNEQAIGHAPRVVVDPHIVRSAKDAVSNYKGAEKMDHILNYLKRDDSDGRYFVDYLKPITLEIGISKEILVAERNSIKEFVSNSISRYADNYKVLCKYEWLNNYIVLTEKYFV